MLRYPQQQQKHYCCVLTLLCPEKSFPAQGQIVLLEIELEGARQVAQSFPDAQRIFIAPPSMQILENRLRQRSTDSDEQIVKRLHHAEMEVAAANEFNITIINDDLGSALQQLESAMFD